MINFNEADHIYFTYRKNVKMFFAKHKYIRQKVRVINLPYFFITYVNISTTYFAIKSFFIK